MNYACHSKVPSDDEKTVHFVQLRIKKYVFWTDKEIQNRLEDEENGFHE